MRGREAAVVAGTGISATTDGGSEGNPAGGWIGTATWGGRFIHSWATAASRAEAMATNPEGMGVGISIVGRNPVGSGAPGMAGAGATIPAGTGRTAHAGSAASVATNAAKVRMAGTCGAVSASDCAARATASRITRGGTEGMATNGARSRMIGRIGAGSAGAPPPTGVGTTRGDDGAMMVAGVVTGDGTGMLERAGTGAGAAGSGMNGPAAARFEVTHTGKVERAAGWAGAGTWPAVLVEGETGPGAGAITSPGTGGGATGMAAIAGAVNIRPTTYPKLMAGTAAADANTGVGPIGTGLGAPVGVEAAGAEAT